MSEAKANEHKDTSYFNGRILSGFAAAAALSEYLPNSAVEHPPTFTNKRAKTDTPAIQKLNKKRTNDQDKEIANLKEQVTLYKDELTKTNQALTKERDDYKRDIATLKEERNAYKQICQSVLAKRKFQQAFDLAQDAVDQAVVAEETAKTALKKAKTASDQAKTASDLAKTTAEQTKNALEEAERALDRDIAVLQQKVGI